MSYTLDKSTPKMDFHVNSGCQKTLKSYHICNIFFEHMFQCKKTALFVRMGIYKGRNDTKRQNVFSWHSSKASLVKNDHIHAWAPISMSPLDADALLQHIDKSLSNVPPLRNSNPPQSMVYVPAIYAFCFLNYHCYCFFSLSFLLLKGIKYTSHEQSVDLSRI